MNAREVLDLRTRRAREAALDEAVSEGARTFVVTFRDLSGAHSGSLRFAREVPAVTEEEAREAAVQWAESVGGTEVVEVEATL